MRAEKYRKLHKAKRLDVFIVRGERAQSPRDIAYSPEKRERRIWELLVPLVRLLPSVGNVFVADRKDVPKGRQKFSYTNFTLPEQPVLKAPTIARSIVEAYLSGIKNPVTITLRCGDFHEQRNSGNEWPAIADWLYSNDCTPIAIRDTEDIMLNGNKDRGFVRYYDAAAFSPDLRLALYEQSKLNLFTSGGPMVLGLYADIAMMAFKIIVPGLQCSSEAFMFRSRMSPYHDWGPRKKIYWLDDTYANVVGVLNKELGRFI